jgi:hypothetical protein
VENFIAENWQALSFIIALIFNAGIMFKTFKEKPSEKRVEEMIEEMFENHCPFTDRIKNLETNKAEQRAYREVLEKELHQENERTHLSLQRMELNLKRVCTKLGLDYLL